MARKPSQEPGGKSASAADDGFSKVEESRDPRGRKRGGRKTGGRKKGTPNKATVQVKEFAQAFLDDNRGRAKMLALYRSGKLHASIIVMLHHYAYGKPKELVELTGKDGGPMELRGLSDADVDRRIAETEAQLRGLVARKIAS